MQHALRDELVEGADKFKAKAAAGLVTRRRTPARSSRWSRCRTSTPNNPGDALDPNRINRLTTGVFEMGSTFKALTTRDGARLRQGQPQLDASMRAAPLRYGRFTIHDYHAQQRVLTRAGGVHLFLEHRHRAHGARRRRRGPQVRSCKKMGQLDRLRTELPESAEPLVPKRWGELNTITIAFGHGLAVAPLQAMMAVGALVNGGI